MKNDGSFTFDAELRQLPDNHPANRKGKIAVISTEELKTSNEK
jgi:hypothetical protein